MLKASPILENKNVPLPCAGTNTCKCSQVHQRKLTEVFSAGNDMILSLYWPIQYVSVFKRKFKCNTNSLVA